jgi:hypothetical protein
MAGKATHPLDTTLELSTAEIAALRYIVEFQKTNKFHQAPSHRELIEHLNTVLPKRSHGGPAISSTVQTYRIATKLRTKGYLIQIEADDEKKARNLVATPTGEKYVREHLQKKTHHA